MKKTTGRQSIHPKTYAAPASPKPRMSREAKKTAHREKMDELKRSRHSMWLHSIPWFASQMNKRNPKRHAAVLGLSRLHPKHPEFRGVR